MNQYLVTCMCMKRFLWSEDIKNKTASNFRNVVFVSSRYVNDKPGRRSGLWFHSSNSQLNIMLNLIIDNKNTEKAFFDKK